MTERRLPDRLRQLAATVRFRITAVATVAVVGVLAATGVGIVLAQRRLLTDNLEDRLRQRADDLAALVTAGRLPATLGGPGENDDIFVQIVGAGGVVVSTTPNMTRQPPLPGPAAGGPPERLRTVDLEAVDDDDFRLYSRRVDGPDGPVVIHVAGDLEDVTESTGVLATSLTVAIPTVAALLAIFVWRVVERTLRPVEAIRAEVAGIGGRALDHRVPEPAGDDEIARLARTMNAMLDRIGEAARQQQQFVADASHELRSPLTRIRSELEVDLAHPGTADLAATHRSVLEETEALQRLISDLLHLARSDAGATTLRRQPVDLDDIVSLEARRLRVEGQVAVDMSGVSAAQVTGDRDQLARAVRNLVDNAAAHARSTVTLTLAEDDGAARLGVADDGPGIPADQRERVFERFTRLDEARSAATGGTGLGLAITRDIVELHGGTIAIDSDHQPGTRFVVMLPLGS